MKVISVCNFKGGVGKTSSSLSIGACLAKKGYRVLLVDLDAQSNLTLSCGLRDVKHTLLDAFIAKGTVSDISVNISDNLTLVPNSIDFCNVESDASKHHQIGLDVILKRLLQPVSDTYDFCLIDAPPSFGLPVKNALAASDHVVIPLLGEYLSSQGLGQLESLISMVKECLNPKLDITAVFLNRFNKQKLISKAVLGSLEKKFGNRLMDTKVREDVSLSESQLEGVPVIKYSPKSRASEDFVKLTNELLEVLNG